MFTFTNVKRRTFALKALVLVICASSLVGCGANGVGGPTGPTPVTPPAGTPWVTIVEGCVVTPKPVAADTRWNATLLVQFSVRDLPFDAVWDIKDSTGVVVWSWTGSGKTFVSSQPGNGGTGGLAPKKAGEYTLTVTAKSAGRPDVSSSCGMSVT